MKMLRALIVALVCSSIICQVYAKDVIVPSTPSAAPAPVAEPKQPDTPILPSPDLPTPMASPIDANEVPVPPTPTPAPQPEPVVAPTTAEPVPSVALLTEVPQTPVDAEAELRQQQIVESLKNMFASFFSPSPDMNDSPFSHMELPAGTVTKQVNIPGGVMIVSEFDSSNTNNGDDEAQQPPQPEETSDEVDPTTVPDNEEGAGVPDETDPTVPQDSDSDDEHGLFAPPPPADNPLSRFLGRFFGQGPPPPPHPFLEHGMFDGEDSEFQLRRQEHIRMDENEDDDEAPHPHGGHHGHHGHHHGHRHGRHGGRGCRKHRMFGRTPLLAKLRSMFRNNDDEPFFPPPPPPMFSGDMDAAPHAGPMPGFFADAPRHGFFERIQSFGPFLRVRFNLGGEGENPTEPPQQPSANEPTPDIMPPFMQDPALNEKDSTVVTEAEDVTRAEVAVPADESSEIRPPTMEESVAAGEGFVAPHMREESMSQMGGMPLNGRMDMDDPTPPSDPSDPSDPSGPPGPPSDPSHSRWGGHHRHRNRVGGWIRHHPVAAGLIGAAILILLIATCVVCYRRRKARRENERRNQGLYQSPPPVAFSQQPHAPAFSSSINNPYAPLSSGPAVEFARPVQAYAY